MGSDYSLPVWPGLLAVLMLFAFPAKAQLETDADFRRQVYLDEYTVGIMLHTRGYGVNFRRMYYLDGYNKAGWELDLVNIRHPKEVKIFNQLDNSARGYVYGKLNSFYSLRAGYSRERILFDKTDRGTVAISLVGSGGLSLGLLKPVFLEIVKPVGNGLYVLSTEQYDPRVHEFGVIYGQASFLRGFDKLSAQPGLYAKLGVSFDYNLIDEKTTTLEAGVIFDYFFKPVPIMAELDENIKNYTLFTQFYITVNFGSKWN